MAGVERGPGHVLEGEVGRILAVGPANADERGAVVAQQARGRGLPAESLPGQRGGLQILSHLSWFPLRCQATAGVSTLRVPSSPDSSVGLYLRDNGGLTSQSTSPGPRRGRAEEKTRDLLGACWGRLLSEIEATRVCQGAARRAPRDDAIAAARRPGDTLAPDRAWAADCPHNDSAFGASLAAW